MNWDAIGAIAELLGAIGVIASLVYLGSQIRQNTSTVRSSTAASLAEAQFSLNTFLAQEDVNGLWWAGLEDPDSLTELERRRFMTVCSTALYLIQQAHSQYREGALSEPSWTGIFGFTKWLARQPGFSAYIRDWSSTVNPELIALIEEILAEQPVAEPEGDSGTALT